MCGRCKKQADGFKDSVDELCEEVETVRDFCYLGDRVNAGGGCEAAVTARARIDCCLLYTSPSPRDLSTSRMPSSA